MVAEIWEKQTKWKTDNRDIHAGTVDKQQPTTKVWNWWTSVRRIWHDDECSNITCTLATMAKPREPTLFHSLHRMVVELRLGAAVKGECKQKI